MAVPIDERARRWVAKMPSAVSGQGGHPATFHVACVLMQGFALSRDQAWPIMLEYNARCVPPWSEQELVHKIVDAERAHGLRRANGNLLPRGCLINASGFRPSKQFRQFFKIEPPKKPEFEKTALSKFAGSLAGNVDLIWLANRSDVDPCTVSPDKFLSLLYRPNEKILIFTDKKSQGEALWPADEIPERGPDGVWFLGQPVDGEYHPNPRQGTMSRRSEEAVTSWRYFVIESDEAKKLRKTGKTKEAIHVLKCWLGAMVQFPLRIAAIYNSGDISVHALVKIDARTKTEWDTEREALKSALVILGADAGAMTAVRLTRLPGCWRGRALQKLLYINPDPPMRAICESAPRRNVLKPWLDWASFGIADSDETNGEALTHALHYYAPVSGECRQALKKIRRQQEKAA